MLVECAITGTNGIIIVIVVVFGIVTGCCARYYDRAGQGRLPHRIQWRALCHTENRRWTPPTFFIICLARPDQLQRSLLQHTTPQQLWEVQYCQPHAHTPNHHTRCQFELLRLRSALIKDGCYDEVKELPFEDDSELLVRGLEQGPYLHKQVHRLYIYF